ncbi:type VI secretion system protein ImpG [Singulisphaera sp. GP187]|uniref:type VI secretion system baseplate subunit TssF n=1 Tax=Singulisphaera sp. GP187 TaxID=1882752 RepID=UPI000926F18E|nr:type VI secretion system baseplate subunit TssF [Singulisphaera sp. GP187]SIO61730.1 type VI secretion system protein ImpG [Singulisphaera sp. GP187]
MIDELLHYYNGELAYLRELGAEFAQKYPKVAARLLLESDKCEDPHVERLLEGVAFLTARIRHKIDDEFPEITDSLLGVLYPHFQRPLPSLSIVQFVLNRAQANLAEGFTIERGSRINSRPVNGAPCPFRTTYPVTLWPIEVVAARLDPDRVVVAGKPPGAVALLQLTLSCLGGAQFSQLAIDRLRFYLDGSGPLPYSLYELLLNNVCQVQVRSKLEDGRYESLVLPPDAIESVGFGRDEGMFDYPNRSFLGYRLIQEYFALPEKFLFFDLTGLQALFGRKFGGSIELMFFLNRSPRNELPVQADTFRLGCTPVVNLYTTVAEPISLSQTQYKYRVVPDVHRQMATEVYSIDRVSSVGGFLDEPLAYEPFYSMRHARQGEAPGAYWYSTRRASQVKDDPGTEVELSFVDPGFNPKLPASETITVHVTCTNRDLPSRLPFGGEQGDFELEGQGPVSRVRCLRKPTKPLRPPLGRNAQWRLISLLSLNHLSLADTEQGLDALHEILMIYNFADSAATRQQIAGVTGVSSRRVPVRTGRKIGSAVCLGTEVTVEFDETHFVGGGVFLLASVLDRFFGLYTSINSFTRMVAKTRQREGILKQWPPRAGERTLL